MENQPEVVAEQAPSPSKPPNGWTVAKQWYGCDFNLAYRLKADPETPAYTVRIKWFTAAGEAAMEGPARLLASGVVEWGKAIPAIALSYGVAKVAELQTWLHNLSTQGPRP